MKWSTDELRKIAESDDRIDDAYRAKYANSPYLEPMISARARSATVRVLPNS